VRNRLINNFDLFIIIMHHTEPKVDFSHSFLVMYDRIMLVKNYGIFEHKHSAFFKLTDMMILPVMLSEHVLIPVDFILW
jgi:hypothetical protein